MRAGSRFISTVNINYFSLTPRLVSCVKKIHIGSMGDLIQMRQHVPVAKNSLQRRAYWEQQRAIAHAQMMMIGATVTTGLMMLGLALLSVLR